MKATELRIGNYIERHNKVIGVKDVIQVDGGTPLLAFEGMTTLKFNPIPLTEEWLLKFGFIKNDWYNGKHFVLNKYCSIIIEKSGCDKGVWYLGDKSDAYCHRLKKIQFIHELQNLYFALESEELTIK